MKDCPLAKIKDSRIYRIFGTVQETNKIHYFEYIVKELLPNVDENVDTTLLDAFVSSLNKVLKSDDTANIKRNNYCLW
jgi:ribosomal protein S18